MRPVEAKRKVSLPRYGDYNCVFKYLLETGVDVKCILPPEITRHTIDLGAKNSPDTVCMPFKTLLGSMIESLEAGSDIIVMSNGQCRLSYFGELQEQILRDMGYQFEFVNLGEYADRKKDFIKAIKRINPKVNLAKFFKSALDALKMLENLDEITSLYYQICGFETTEGASKKAFRQYLDDMYQASTRADIDAGYKRVKATLESIPLQKPVHPLRVGIVGEYFTVMDPPSNLYLEEKLAKMGVEVWRWMNLSYSQMKSQGDRNLHVRIRDLCTYDMGPTSTANLWCATKWAEEGFDGLIHVKSAACTPEIDIMPLLQQIGQKHKIPVLFLNYDAQTSDVGIMTRLEAFYDMIAMRKRI